MAKLRRLENTIKQTRVLSNRITLKRISGDNREVYVNDSEVRLGKVVKQCTGLYQPAHFCIYYFMRS